MPSITFLPDNIKEEIHADETILDVAQRVLHTFDACMPGGRTVFDMPYPDH